MHGAKMKEFFIRRDVRLFDIFLLKPNKNLVYLKNRTKFDRNMYRWDANNWRYVIDCCRKIKVTRQHHMYYQADSTVRHYKETVLDVTGV